MINAYYILLPAIATVLTVAQVCWNSFIKGSDVFNGSIVAVAQNILGSPRFWIGAILYAFATLLYFLALSKISFFVVQVTVTALALICSTLIAHLFFHENLAFINYAGTVMVIAGLGLVMVR